MSWEGYGGHRYSEMPWAGDEEPEERPCRVCGCTESDCRSCIERTGEPTGILLEGAQGLVRAVIPLQEGAR